MPRTRPKKLTKSGTKQGVRKPDALAALAWLRVEEGLSARAVARELGISPAYVAEILARDTPRRESIRARLREEREAAWSVYEREARDAALIWIRLATNAGAKAAGDVRKLPNCAGMAHVPPMLRALAGAAERSTRAAELVGGRATDRVEHAGTLATAEVSADDLIAQALDLGCIDRLPESLRAIAAARQETRQIAQDGRAVAPGSIAGAPPPPRTTGATADRSGDSR